MRLIQRVKCFGASTVCDLWLGSAACYMCVVCVCVYIYIYKKMNKQFGLIAKRQHTKLFPNWCVFILHWRLKTAEIIVMWPNRLMSSDLHLTSFHSHPTPCQILAPDAFWHQYQLLTLLHLAAPGKKTSKLSAGHGRHKSEDLPEQCCVRLWFNHEVPHNDGMVVLDFTRGHLKKKKSQQTKISSAQSK